MKSWLRRNLGSFTISGTRIVMQSTTVKQQGNWAQGLNDLNEHRKSVHACDLKSTVSEHANWETGHSIDEISVEIIGQENHLMPLRKILTPGH